MQRLSPRMDLDEDSVRRLRDAFAQHDYRVDAVVNRIGTAAHAALGRNQATPGRRALAGARDPLAVLTLLWPLQTAVSRDAAEATLPGLVEPLLTAGILAADGATVSARVDLRPYASDDDDHWVVSDLTPGMDGRIDRVPTDFVLGVSSASSTLAQLTSRRPVGRALDLGTGCGVQSLHLARHAREVVGTDVNPRALAHADLTCRLSGVDVDLRVGSLYEPVADEGFDLITTNPPYVLSPPDGHRLIYREGSMTGDGLVRQVVVDGAGHLRPGGTLQVLANWAHLRDRDWAGRLAAWLEPSGCDVHVVQREVLDVDEYVELWLADAGLVNHPDYPRRYAAWLDYFDRLGIVAVGMGWITARHTGRADPDVSVEEWPHSIEQPIGPAIDARAAAVDLVRDLSADQLLGQRWVLADDVVEETFGTPGWSDPHRIVLRQQRGFRRALEVDTALGGVLGACDGELTLHQIVDGVASLLTVEPAALTAEIAGRVPDLVRDGFLRADP